MESYPSKMGLCAVVAFGLAMVATFSACGDENTNVTEVSESTGLDIIAKGDTLPECGSDNAGEMVFVTDSAAVYYCADEKWSMLNGKDGEKGDKGDAGAEGKATDGTSCTAKTVENGIEVSCGGSVVGTLKNGNPGVATNGSDGKSACALALDKDEECSEDELANWLASLKGKSCSAEKKDDGSIEVSCGGEVVGTLTNGTNGKSAYELARENDENVGELADWLASLKGNAGENCTIADVKDPNDATKVIGYEVTCGEDKKTVRNGTDGVPGVGCTVKDNGDGKVDVTCGDGEPVTLFKAMCELESYDPTKKFCIDGETYDLCGGKIYDLETQYCSAQGVVENQKSCEGNFYNPEIQYCSALNEVKNLSNCGEGLYNPETQYCLTLKDEDGEPVSKVEALLIDDRDESNVQKYKTVTVGSQVWMAENLNYNTNVGDETNSWCGGGKSGSINEGECSVYGRLYMWDAAKSACPADWHLPNNEEWKILFKAVDATYTAESNTVGSKLKSASGWKDSGDGYDSFGFAVLPAGIRRYSDHIFMDQGYLAFFWSSTEFNSEFAYDWNFVNDEANVSDDYDLKNAGFSVRCLKDSDDEE